MERFFYLKKVLVVLRDRLNSMVIWKLSGAMVFSSSVVYETTALKFVRILIALGWSRKRIKLYSCARVYEKQCSFSWSSPGCVGGAKYNNINQAFLFCFSLDKLAQAVKQNESVGHMIVYLLSFSLNEKDGPGYIAHDNSNQLTRSASRHRTT
jgi:hypothetical protein